MNVQQCPRCSKTLPAYARFCDECGTKIIIVPLRNDAVDKNLMSGKSEEATATDSTTPKQPIPLKKKSKRAGCIWAVVVVVVLFFMFIGHLIEEDRRTREWEWFERRNATREEGVVINGVRWATRNVGTAGTFADNPESAGMFFQWNRRQDWCPTFTNASAFTNPSEWMPTGTAWYAENDPCPDGWRVPTADELRSLRMSGSSSTSFNDVNGMLFGAAPNQIFLPAVGLRAVQDGEWRYRRGGYYWSSVADYIPYYAPYYAAMLAFSHYYHRIAHIIRVMAAPIRCVADEPNLGTNTHSPNNNILLEGFRSYTLPDVGHISIPANMELRVGDFIGESDMRAQGFTVFQKKGVNDGGAQAFLSNYVRVAINTTMGNYGRIRRSDFSAADLRTISNNTRMEFQRIGIEIVEWKGVSLVSINNHLALRTSFVRKPVYTTRWYSQSPVAVTMYQFFNGDRHHLLKTEYRVSEAEIWEAPLEKVVNSFTITNVR